MPMTIEMKAEANSSFFILHSSFFILHFQDYGKLL